MIIPKASSSLLTICATVLLVSRPVRVFGFGQRFEVVKGGGFGVTGNAVSSLKAKKDEQDSAEDESFGDYRERLERSFSVFDGDRSDPLSAFLREDVNHDDHGHSAVENHEDGAEQNIIVSSLDRLFNTDDTDEEGIYLCDGDDCDLGDECKIPFKMGPEDESVDVMAFLGIQRAEPVKRGAEECQ